MPNLTIGPQQHTPAWYALRRAGTRTFGASWAAPLCGQSRYATALDVYSWCVGLAEPEVNEAACRRGSIYERAVLEDYAWERETPVLAALPSVVNPDYPVLSASLDGCLSPFEDQEEAVCDYSDFIAPPVICDPVEVKWSVSPAIAQDLGDEGTDYVPTEWLLQVQQQMLVTEQPRADIAVCLWGRLRIYEIAANDTLQRAILAAAKEMLERIDNRDPPEPQWEHPHVLRAVKAAHGHDGTVIDVSEDVAMMCDQYDYYRTMAANHEKKAKESQARVLHAIQAASKAEGNGWRVSRSMVKESTWTEEAIEEARRKAAALEVGAVRRKSYPRITITRRESK